MKTEIEQCRNAIKEYRKGYGQSQLPTDCIIQLMIGHAKSEQLLIQRVSNQRELLISFKDFYNKKMEEYALHCGIDIALIDEFERNL